MKTRHELLDSIAETIKDYRKGARSPLDADHVERWVNQFDLPVQLPILNELNHVLEQTYVDQETLATFLKSLITSNELAGEDPCFFWKSVQFLDIQSGGSSQREMLAIFSVFLKEHCGFGVEECGAEATTFIYIDDAIFTGNTVLKDLTAWIKSDAPDRADVHIFTLAFHRGGQYYAKTKIAEASKAAGKSITLHWYRCIELEDTRQRINSSDVLRPRSLGADPRVAAYAASLEYPPIFRTQASIGEHEIFSSEAGRDVLEQEMLKAGAKIRDLCPHLGTYQRPLGNMVLQTLGFGSTIVTFRNCPNNAPLAFWAGDPWYPLFERKTNRHNDLSAFRIEI